LSPLVRALIEVDVAGMREIDVTPAPFPSSARQTLKPASTLSSLSARKHPSRTLDTSRPLLRATPGPSPCRRGRRVRAAFVRSRLEYERARDGHRFARLAVTSL